MKLTPSRARRGRRVRVVIAVQLALVGVALIWASLGRTATPDATPAIAPVRHTMKSTVPHAAQPTSRPAAAHAGKTGVRDKIAGMTLPASEPVAVSIPTLGVRSTLVELGLDRDGAMEVPQDPALAGWFSRGAAPGALGPAVIAGHVTWNGAPGVFHRLGSMRRGDRVAVTRKDGTIIFFSVTRVGSYSKSRFPSRAVYGAINHAGLRLITCGGAYDSARHRYLENVVVFARLVEVQRSRG